MVLNGYGLGLIKVQPTERVQKKEAFLTRDRIKNCDACKQVATTLYRCQLHAAQTDAAQNWQLICKDCWARLSPGNPHYRYGGTWKAKKRH